MKKNTSFCYLPEIRKTIANSMNPLHLWGRWLVRENRNPCKTHIYQNQCISHDSWEKNGFCFPCTFQTSHDVIFLAEHIKTLTFLLTRRLKSRGKNIYFLGLQPLRFMRGKKKKSLGINVHCKENTISLLQCFGNYSYMQICFHFVKNLPYSECT